MWKPTLALTVAAMVAASALVAAAASKPLAKPKRVAASINATVTGPAPLPCTTGASYAATCPGSSGACTCLTLAGTATGGFGKATVAGALTLDGLDATPEGGCTPFFGSLALTATKPAAVMILDINGSLCNATAPNTSKTIGGGFDFDPLTIDFIGTGSLAGTISGTTARLKLIGAAAPVATPTPTPPM
jgi:hypothetical protein